jgi:ubiquinol-cytochrome c reductase cytochrome c subunit
MAGRTAAAVRPAQAGGRGQLLYQQSCSSCHGQRGEGTERGPSLIGVGAAAVEFQVGTGRMPMAEPGPQAPEATKRFNAQEVRQLSAYVGSLAPGPAVPDAQFTTAEGGNAAIGGEIFRVNCAMCHNFAGAGGALTRGKYAPSLQDTSPKHIYEAMLTGPQSMPVFNDKNITPENKKNLIAFLEASRNTPHAGGSSLGNLGPVPEGLVTWIVGIGALIGCAVWLGSKAA